MPSKEFTLDSGQDITIYKRRSNRNVRLSVGPSGKVRVSIPAWAPYSAGLNFAKSRQQWIAEQIIPKTILRHGQAVGKAHHLVFVAKDIGRPTSRISGTNIVISHPVDGAPDDLSAQRVAGEACVRSLRLQAEQLLPQRLAELAEAQGFSYTSVSIKRLQSRWGSCDQHGHIILNLFLMQLPWELIDYVLLHELTHTRVLRHGPDFWQALQSVMPESKDLKKRLRDYQPVLAGG